MKKFLALLLTLTFTLSLCACGGSGSANSPAPTSGSDTPASGTPDGASDEKKPEAPAAGHLTYDDLDETQNSWIWLDEGDIQLQYDYPGGYRFEDHGHGMGSENDRDFSILAVHAEQPMPDTSLEDAFYTLLNGEDGFHAILRMVLNAVYDDIVTDETEYVTLDCGREAIKFSGTQHMDDSGTIADCPIRGYCMMLNDIPIIVCYIIFDEAGLEADLLEELEGALSPEEMAHYVDEIINTFRIVEE